MVRKRERSGGQALVELAVVLPVVILLLLALFDAGRAVVFYAELTNVARVAARVAIVNQSNDATCTSSDRTFKCEAAGQSTGLGLDAATIPDLTIAGTDCAIPSNCTATVTVSYVFDPVTPVVGSMIGEVVLSASETMPIERTYIHP